jgi:hypothetical protein
VVNSNDATGAALTADITPLKEIKEDLRDRLVLKLEQEGLSVPDTARKKVDAALIAVLRIPHRTIQRRPRAVHFSRELEARRSKLTQEVLDALQVVADELERGDDVTQRLTRKHFKAGFNDRIYNDLGVQHLHLGPRNQALDATGRHMMSEGQDDLLWVIVRPDDVYLIDVLGHGAFTKYAFGQVVYDNWKYLLGEPLEGTTQDDEDVLSEDVRGTLRKAGLTTFLTINGECFLPGGYMKDGTSEEVVRVAFHLLNKLVDLYQWLERNIEPILDDLTELTGARIGGLDLRVRDLDAFVHGEISLAEGNTGEVFVLADGKTHFGSLKPENRPA